MKILALTSYPEEAAATRFRVGQFIGPLATRGIEIELRPFLDGDQFRSLYRSGNTAAKLAGMAGSISKRIGGLANARQYDLLFVQREAMFFGPAIFEWLYQRIGRMPMVLDLDDATYVPYDSPTYGRIGSFLKFFGKTNRLIDRADLVICGNRFIAEYVEKRGTRTVVIPTIVDTDQFIPIDKTNAVPVLGWIGTHSTFPFLTKLFPVLSDLALKHTFRLKIVGSGAESVEIPGIEIENLQWDLEREIADFQLLDIGLYPMSVSDSANDDWLAGKSGFKAVQYMAVGIPSVMSPVGVCAEMGETGKTHFNAETPQDWYNHLDKLLSDRDLRVRMGENARRYAVEHFSLGKHSQTLADAFESVLAR